MLHVFIHAFIFMGLSCVCCMCIPTIIFIENHCRNDLISSYSAFMGAKRALRAHLNYV
jgi:hypothetical protein